MLLSFGCTCSLLCFREIIGSTFTAVSLMCLITLIEPSGRDHHNPGIREIAGKRCRPAAQADASGQRERKRPGSRRKRSPHQQTWPETAAPPLPGLDPQIAREGRRGGLRVERTGL